MLISVIFLINLLNKCLCIHIRSSCGHPGLPPDSVIYQVDPDRNRFDDGDVVRYRCVAEFHTHKQTRKCVAGRWVGKTARCGVPIENDIKSVEVFDCSRGEDTQNATFHRKILDLEIKQTSNPLQLTNSFHASRRMSGTIQVNGSTCYLWKIKLEKPTMVSFLTLDFASEITETDREDNSSTLRKDILTVDPFVSPYRICRSLQDDNFIQNDPDSNSTFLLKGFYFRCDSISEKEYLIEQNKESQQLMIETRTNHKRDVHLVAILLAKHKLNPKNGRPDCGKPETVSTGVNHRLVFDTVKGVSQFQVQCNDSFIDVTPNKPIDRKPNYWYRLNCSVNGLWEGEFPLCIPNIQCPGLEYLNQNKDPSIDIESIQNVYYTNDSQWVAGEHSYVTFACANPEHIVVGKLIITCMRNGKWSTNMPKCSAYVRPESLSTVAHSPWTVITILTLFLLLFLSMVLLIVRRYVTNMRKELMRYRNKSRKEASIYTDIKTNSFNYIYDDCDTSGHNSRQNARTVRTTKKGLSKFKMETEYIELEATHSRSSASTEPLYIPILPPLQ